LGLAERLLAPQSGLVFIRMSINAISPRAVKLHWGISFDEVKPQLEGLKELLKARQKLLPEFQRKNLQVPSIQISTILDKNNVDDLLLICKTIAVIMNNYPDCRGEEDVIVVRPLTIHGRKNGYSTYSDLIQNEYAQREISWANGIFLTVGPDSSVYLSTEHNCDKNWALGNLKIQSVAEIYKSKRRRDILEYMNNHRWGPEVSQPTSRTARLDRIANAIMSGQLTDVDIEQIRKRSLNCHSLILD
jgi:hypothetical protein